MKLYMIVYIAGKVAGFNGPLDVSLEDCIHEAKIQDAVCIVGAYKCSDIRHACEWRTGQPPLDPSFIN